MLEAFLAFALFLSLQAWRMAPSIAFGDSGEFAAASAILGLAHPPAYPLYALSARAFASALFLGDWAYRTNLFSAACGAASAALLLCALRRAGFGAAARWGGILVVGLSPVWLRETSVTEVFALHCLLLAVLLWLRERFRGALCEPKPMAAMGLALGLGLANHHTLLLAAPVFAMDAAVPRRTFRGALAFAAFCAVGLAAYAYLPLRSVRVPALDWGHPTDLSRFLRVLSRKDYGSLSLTTAGQEAGGLTRLRQLARYGRFSAGELGIPAAALAVLGCARRGSLFPLAGLILTGPFFLVLGNPPFDAMTTGALERFYLASWMFASFLVAAGLEATGPRLSWAALAAALALRGAPAASDRADLAAYDYGRNLLRSLPKGASLFMDGGDDTFFSLAYLTMARRERGDLDLHDRGALVYRNPYGFDFRSLTSSQKEARRAQVESGLARRGAIYYSTLNAELLPGFRLNPAGLLRSAGLGAEPHPELWDIYPLRFQEEALRRRYRDRALAPLYPVMRSEVLDDTEALRELRWAWSLGPDVLWLKPAAAFSLAKIGYRAIASGRWALAQDAYGLGTRVAPENPEAWLGLGVAAERSGRAAAAEEDYRRALKLDAGSVHGWRNLGALLWSQSRWREASEAFDAASRLDPGDPSSSKFSAEARRRAEKKG